MMKNNLVILMGLALMGAAPASTPPPDDTGIENAIAWCAAASAMYRSGQAGRERVAREMSKLEPATQQGLAIVCRAYVQGYGDGQRDLMKNTT